MQLKNGVMAYIEKKILPAPKKNIFLSLDSAKNLICLNTVNN
jgi:hypothetical protein